MRMFRLSSWISESRGCDKGIDGNVNHKMANATPVVEIFSRGDSAGELGKRKRAVEEELAAEAEERYEAKKRKLDGEVNVSIASEDIIKMESTKKTSTVADSRQVRDAIESQFSLEILLKHDELRLINQELAKCQAAMEQLRRCHLIPYPSSLGNPESMLEISNGTGAAVKLGDNVPRWAPAYGVSDGPYTKHYSKWLISDYSFDGQDEWRGFPESSRVAKHGADGRSTRNSLGGDGSTPINKSRSQRGSTGQKLQALSSGYPLAKEKAGPCVAKRSDGQMVKLVCLDCNRDNFSSVQGFINHCRIAHRREFKSHEEAAQTSGQPIELDETGGIVGEEKIQAGDGLVHPLIKSAPVDREAYKDLLSHIKKSLELFGQGKLPGVTSIPTGQPLAPTTPIQQQERLVPSSDTPHLSSLMQRRGLGGNLPDMVVEAKTPIEFEEESDEGESSEQRPIGGLDGCDSPPPAMRVPARAAMSPAPFGRPGSSKGMESVLARKPGGPPRTPFTTPPINTTASTNHTKPSPLVVNGHHEDFRFRHNGELDVDIIGPSLVDLSPNTVASNSAPSLVSDDGEYEDGDDAESVSSEMEEEGSDVAEIDIEDGEGEKVVARTVLRNRSGSGGDHMRMKKEDKHVKHVTFVSPVKDTKAKGGRTRK